MSDTQLTNEKIIEMQNNIIDKINLSFYNKCFDKSLNKILDQYLIFVKSKNKIMNEEKIKENHNIIINDIFFEFILTNSIKSQIITILILICMSFYMTFYYIPKSIFKYATSSGGSKYPLLAKQNKKMYKILKKV